MDRPQEIARKVFFSLCISAFTITTKFGIQIMRELNVRHNSRNFFQKLRDYEKNIPVKLKCLFLLQFELFIFLIKSYEKQTFEILQLEEISTLN